MAIDTPAKIAVLGAGPIGLEAALYARFLGYDVEIYERGRVAESVVTWGHVRMFSPFGVNHSSLGLAALEAHNESYQPPGDGELLTCRQWAERYLIPLSQTDLLAEHLRLETEVLAIGKDEIHKGDLPGHEDRGDWDFRLLVRDQSGREEIRKADAVLDATGVFGHPNYLGQGGIPAVGELALRGDIEYGFPDLLGADRGLYAGRHTLVVGAGLSAATTVTALAQLAEDLPRTRITWVTRGEPSPAGPIAVYPHDPFVERERLASAANHLATANGTCVTWWPGTFIDRVRHDAGEFEVLLSGLHEGEHRFDRIVANVGHRPDDRLGRDLQSPEPNFYVLGAKSRGRDSSFLFADGLTQIREVFAIIGDRPDLDLYAGARKLVREAK